MMPPRCGPAAAWNPLHHVVGWWRRVEQASSTLIRQSRESCYSPAAPTPHPPPVQLSLLYANVSPDDILLRHELDALAAAHPNFRVWYTGAPSVVASARLVLSRQRCCHVYCDAAFGAVAGRLRVPGLCRSGCRVCLQWIDLPAQLLFSSSSHLPAAPAPPPMALCVQWTRRTRAGPSPRVSSTRTWSASACSLVSDQQLGCLTAFLRFCGLFLGSRPAAVSSHSPPPSWLLACSWSRHCVRAVRPASHD